MTDALRMSPKGRLRRRQRSGCAAGRFQASPTSTVTRSSTVCAEPRNPAAGILGRGPRAIFAAAGSWDPDNSYESSTAVFREMLQAGITAVGEFHYLHRH